MHPSSTENKVISERSIIDARFGTKRSFQETVRVEHLRVFEKLRIVTNTP